ncbi:M23 family metallopeptidase [Thermoanaerobacterium sp. RBIITD]|uniref:murein hydrolase activator EnvC family protein n=1 Tax=Thermoanaerobacterium sp. RBIITD TaxID=1550240 RepID=UPI000BB92E86|nr:M23 family metallopeptidase [Thermoanaerobacterium sp. RBIITD]SNX54609.1 Septal ring factor EnvC, activator of murein hydrolases AmiA and AmiB [Thermoanaerobacterium sp. RBIITD]
MKEGRYRRIAFMVLLSVSILISSSPKADQLQDAKNKLNNVQNSINQNKAAQNQIAEQKKDLANELQNLDMKLNDTTKQLNDAQNKLNDIIAKLNKTQQDLDEAKKVEEKQQNTLKERVRAMYIGGGETGYLDVLLSSKSFADFITRLDVIKKLVGFDVNLLNSYQKQRQIVENKAKQLALVKKDAENYKNQVALRKRDIEVAMVSRQGIMRDLERQQKLYEEQEQALLNQSKQLEGIIASLQAKSSVVYSGGKLGWPVPSSSIITSPFGTRYHPILHEYKTHTGIDISASYGAAVVAAGDGKVIFAGYYGGYGNAVIIDHGGGISTLYGHNSELLVSVGDTVKRGQQIAKAGSTGLSTGPHCHFEVRKNGVPVNPMDWLK